MSQATQAAHAALTATATGLAAGLTGLLTGVGTIGIAFLILLISYIALAAILSQKSNNPMQWRSWNPLHWCWNPVKWLTKDCIVEQMINVDDFMGKKK